MPIGLLGKKVGMSRVFTEDGRAIAVTVLQMPVNRVAQVKTVERNGYDAVQLAAYECDPARLSKPLAGHLSKLGGDKGYSFIREFRTNQQETAKLGDSLDLGIFEPGQKVKVTGVSKGKGFAGTIKRHNFRGQDRSHGNSRSHRVAGSVGQCQTPGKVFKGKKMAGRMGGKRATVINAEVVKVDRERELLMLKGAVPGAPDSRVMVQHLRHIDLATVGASGTRPPEEHKDAN